MTTRKKTDKDFQAKVKKSASKIWLAGLGAFALAEEEGGKVFRSLVKRGEALEEKGKEQFEGLRDRVEEIADTARSRATEVAGQVEKRAGKAWKKVEGNLDDAVGAALGKVGVPTRDEISRLTRRIEELTSLVAAKVGAKKPARRKPRRAAPRRAG